MRTFNLVIQDVRCAAPMLEQATARDSDGARQIARRRLEESPFHVSVEVRDEAELLCWFRRMDHSAALLQAAQ